MVLTKEIQTLATTTATLPVMESFYTLQGEGYHAGKAAYFIRLGGCNVGCVWCDVKESWDATAHPQYTIEEIVRLAEAEGRQQTTDHGRQTTDGGRQTTDGGRQTTDGRQQTTDDGRQTTDNRRQTADDGRQTAGLMHQQAFRENDNCYPVNRPSSVVHRPSSNIVVVTGGEPLMHHLDELTTALQQAGFQTNIETSGSSPLSGHWDWICLSPKKFKAPLPEILPQANELKVVIFNKTDFAWAEQHAARTNPACKLYLQAEWSRREQVMPLIVDYIKTHPQWQLSLQVHKYINVP